jgi:hypothetical protein
LHPFPRWSRRSSRPIPDGCAVAASSPSLVLVRWRQFAIATSPIPTCMNEKLFPNATKAVSQICPGTGRKNRVTRPALRN